MNSPRPILMVEDSVRDAEMAMAALADYNLANDVVHVRDGAEALDYLYRRGPFADRPPGNPAVVLLDLKMPKVDGLEVLRQIKNDPALLAMHVIVMTALRADQDLVNSFSLGVNAFVVKPLKFREFVEALKPMGGTWELVSQPPLGRRSRQVILLPT